jgi:flagellar biosynthesis component FlhA
MVRDITRSKWNSLLDELKHEFPNLKEEDLLNMEISVNNLMHVLQEKTHMSEPELVSIMDEKMEYINAKDIV